MSRIPYNMMPNLGTLQAGDVVPCLRPPFNEGAAFVSDIQKYIRPYDVYTALISQSGTSDPTVIVLENTIGDIEWTYNRVGVYTGALLGAFTTNKVWVTITNSDAITEGLFYTIDVENNDKVYITTSDNSASYANSLLSNTSIEIRRYYSEPA